MYKYYGVCTGEQGTGVGDIIEGTEWRYGEKKDDPDYDGQEILTTSGNWVEVFCVFRCNNLEMVSL